MSDARRIDRAVVERSWRERGFSCGLWVDPPGQVQAGREAGPQKESLCLAATVEEPRNQRTARVDWAGLLRRTFALDVFTCARCGGRRRVLAYLMAYA
ncbi:hypothetical protein [Vitiosangium sp. GDMCC 1.1324]|uniref:hypothetical protein n=1 Tax=Vitiosangium sp. (strain GDMCC 1.1324) TaxID=2138576 RepID=UPI001E315A16|nr:hypothetical protein [Vitiosangium sp. GDMCC 1.1324]